MRLDLLKRCGIASALLLLTLAVQGCATVPVRAWQRERLVDPIMAFRAEAREDARKQDLSGPLVIVMGNEREGLMPRVREQCDAKYCQGVPDHSGLLKINWSVAARRVPAGKDLLMRSNTCAAAARQPVSLPP